MDKAPFLSVVTASFNARRTIGKTLASICGQSFSDFEHIVADGGSTDGTIEPLQEYQTHYPLRWFSEPDRGIAEALNKGIACATGRYLLVLQADDMLIGDTILESVCRLLRNESYDVYSFPVIRERLGGPEFIYRPIRIPGWFHFKHTIPHQGAFVHRRVYDRIGAFRNDFSIAMDYDFFYRAFKAGVRIQYGYTPVARMGGGGISSANRSLINRLDEERRVQETNERNPAWRAAQIIFRRLYLPYKTRILR